MSGQRRRTSTRVSPPAGAPAGVPAGAGAGGCRRCRHRRRRRPLGDRRGVRGDGRGRRRLGGRLRRAHVGGGADHGTDLEGRLVLARRGGGRRSVLRGRCRWADRGGLRGRRTGDRDPALDPVQPRQHALGRVVGTGQQHPGADELEQQPRCGGAAHLGQPGRDQVSGTAQLGAAEAGRLRDESLPLVLGDVDQSGGRRIGDGVHDDQVAQPAQQVLGEAAGILAGLDHLVDDAEDRGPVGGGEGVDHLVEQGVRGVAEQPGRQRIGDALGTRPTQQLVQHREGVARRAGAGPHDQRDRRGLDGDALLVAQLGEVRREQPGRDQPERVVVGPGPDGREHLVGLRGREDEPQVRRRLLDELEQGVEALRGDHVRLVDDVDLVAAAHRREERLLAQVAGVVHPTVRGGVDLDDVDGAGTAAGQVDAAVADPAGVGHRGPVAVEGAGQDPGRGGLATAARAREEIGVVDPVVGQGSAQRRRDVVLTDDLGKRLGPVAAVQREG